MRHRRSGLACAVIAVCLLAGPARGDDETPCVTPLPLRASPPGSVTTRRTSIEINGQTLTLSLLVQVSAPATIRFTGPSFQWTGDSDPYPARQFPELKITLDGHPAPLHDNSTATFGGRDITTTVAASGLDIFSIAQSPPVVFPVPGRQAAFQALVARHAIMATAGLDLAAWSARRALSFPVASGTHEVMLTYTARPASALLPAAQAEASIPAKTYCLSPPALRKQMAAAAHDGVVIVTRYTIPIGLGLNPAAPIGLQIHNIGGKTFAASIVDFCTAAGRPAPARLPAQAMLDQSGTITILTLGSAIMP